MYKILGRDEEIGTLKEILHTQQPQFLAVYGRRRVGKTYLIRNYFANKNGVIFFDVTGSQHSSSEDQIANFTDRMGEVFYNNAKLIREKSWRGVFKVLTETMSALPKEKKIVLFFDEFPWMVTRKSGLLQTLDYFWNQYWSKDARIKLIICGSSASWIIDKIINNKGGLHNRITHSVLLEPFKLRATKQYLEQRGFKMSNKHIADLYMVTGGIPYYLEKLQKGLSVAQNIEQLVFRSNAFLLKEFDNLFASLFENAEIYIEIIKVIASVRSGMAQKEIFKRVKDISKGGQATKKLQALEDVGFIKGFTPHFHTTRGKYYRVIDEFTIFYLKWVEPIRKTLFESGVSKHYWENEMQTSSWASWAGYAFEAICYKHLKEISAALKITPTAIPNSWRYAPSKGSNVDGAQVDLLFDRKDDAITLCEIKYSIKPFVIDKEYAANIKRKIAVFKKQTRTNKQIFVSMIAANGVRHDAYADELITSSVTLNDLFVS